jgi:hypothetical protein
MVCMVFSGSRWSCRASRVSPGAYSEQSVGEYTCRSALCHSAPKAKAGGKVKGGELNWREKGFMGEGRRGVCVLPR